MAGIKAEREVETFICFCCPIAAIAKMIFDISSSNKQFGIFVRKFFKDLKNSSSQEQWRKKANDSFDKVVDLQSNFNRLVLFDGHQWHGAENFGTEKEDRLTLITFFRSPMLSL